MFIFRKLKIFFGVEIFGIDCIYYVESCRMWEYMGEGVGLLRSDIFS